MYTFKTTQHIRIYSYIPESPGAANKHERIYEETRNLGLIEAYSLRIAEVLEKNPDSETAIQKTLAEMSESII